MVRYRFSALVVGALLIAQLALTACSSDSVAVNREELLYGAHFWQRSEASSAIYQRGPKAQQMLNRDIARCVTELRELERLGAIRFVTPGDVSHYDYDAEAMAPPLSQWDTPDRDGYLRAEHLPYHNFESCMMAKGWERVEHVPYDVADEGRADYLDAVIGERYRTRTLQRQSPLVNPNNDYSNYER